MWHICHKLTTLSVANAAGASGHNDIVHVGASAFGGPRRLCSHHAIMTEIAAALAVGDGDLWCVRSKRRTRWLRERPGETERHTTATPDFE